MKKFLQLFTFFILTTSLVVIAVVVYQIQSDKDKIEDVAANNDRLFDMLDYMVADNPKLSLQNSDPAKSQSHLDTTKYADRFYYVKFPKQTGFEIFTWDDEYIYLNYDSTNITTRTFLNSDGEKRQPWAKRFMKIGDTFNIDYTVNFFENGTCNLIRSLPFRKVYKLKQFIPGYPFGNDIGRRDALIYESNWGDNSGTFENFYYTKEFGWVKHERYTNNSLDRTSSFTKALALQEKYIPSDQDCHDHPKRYGAQKLSAAFPSTINPDEPVKIKIELLNTSNHAWENTTHKLYLKSFADVNLTTRAVLTAKENVVPPGEVATFVTNITAPSQVKSESLTYQMKHSNVWFGQNVNVAITVRTRAEQPTSSFCSGLDVNSDNLINIVDFSNFARSYGKSCLNDPSVNYGVCGSIDQNDDGKISVVDFSIIAKQYGKACQ